MSTLILDRDYVAQGRPSNFWTGKGNRNETTTYSNNYNYNPHYYNNTQSNSEQNLRGHIVSQCGIGPLSGGYFSTSKR
jgi:hypothetical protein